MAKGLGRARNKHKFSKWSFYLVGDGFKNNETVKKVRENCNSTKARVAGGPPQSLRMEKITKNKVEITWPAAVVVDTCVRVLKNALGDNWKDCVTEPSGVRGSEQEAATDEAAPGEEAAEDQTLEEIIGEALTTDKTTASGRQADEENAPSSPPAAAARGASSSGAMGRPQAWEGPPRPVQDGANLLALKLEAVGHVFSNKDPTRFEDLANGYEVDWQAELGHGTYGKVYLSTRRCDKLGLAVKMLRDSPEDAEKGFNSDAFGAADDEVRRHVALGLHQNIVRLVDVGLFRQLESEGKKKLQQSSSKASWRWNWHIGLVFDLYECDVRQFLQKSSFSTGGARHVMNSVLDGLHFIHERGCVHGDIKPANILMRGSVYVRGCFEKESLTEREVGEWDPVEPTEMSKLEFEYQIPRSFEALGSSGRKFEVTSSASKQS